MLNVANSQCSIVFNILIMVTLLSWNLYKM